MIITYERPDDLDTQTDPNAPDADLDPTGAACGITTWDVGGMEWHCTRRPGHTDDEHRAAFDRNGAGPVGHVGFAWQDAWNGAGGPTVDDPAETLTITVTAPRHLLDRVSAEQHAAAIRELFWEDEHDHITITTQR